LGVDGGGGSWGAGRRTHPRRIRFSCPQPGRMTCARDIMPPPEMPLLSRFRSSTAAPARRASSNAAAPLSPTPLPASMSFFSVRLLRSPAAMATAPAARMLLRLRSSVSSPVLVLSASPQRSAEMSPTMASTAAAA
jgi:hypothetical protein